MNFAELAGRPAAYRVSHVIHDQSGRNIRKAVVAEAYRTTGRAISGPIRNPAWSGVRQAFWPLECVEGITHEFR